MVRPARLDVNARWGSVLSILSLLAALVLFAASPAGARPESTRSIKLRLLTGYEQTYGVGPQLLVLGSSRGMRSDPEYLRRLLGVTGFNAGVGSGTPPDALSFLRITRALYPSQPFGVLYLLDIENMRLTGFSRYFRSVPQLAQNLPSGAPCLETVSAASPPASVSAITERAVADEPAGISLVRAANAMYPTYGDRHSHWAANGYLIWCIYDYERKRGVTALKRLPFQLRQYRKVYPSDQPGGMSKDARWYVRQVVKEANEMGVTPVIALTPYHPRLLKMLKTRGWNYVHRRIVGYLRGLRSDFRLQILDFTRVKSFGGWCGGFYDGVHSRPAQMQRLLRAVAAKAGDKLVVPQPTPVPTPTEPPYGVEPGL